MSVIHQGPSRRLTVAVVGGGATGTGIASEAARRGYNVILIERGELGSGTSSHFHGMLHSGARYAVNDPATAAECYQENQLLRSLIPTSIHDTGGMFVALNSQEAEHADILIRACTAAGIPTQEISRAEALAREPALNPALMRAFIVPDGFIDGAEVIRLNQQAAMGADGTAVFMTHHRVTALHRAHDIITSLSVQNVRTGAVETVYCDYVINAAGVWAGRITALAGIDLPIVFDKGTMITYREELTTAVLNRCREEADGDLLVPSGHGSIMGTTARVIDDPDNCRPTDEEIAVLVREGTAMVPALAGARATRTYAGVRPLLASGAADTSAGTRAISRSFRVLDHTEAGISNFVSITGGKVTLYRRMAAAAVDMLAHKSTAHRPKNLILPLRGRRRTPAHSPVSSVLSKSS